MDSPPGYTCAMASWTSERAAAEAAGQEEEDGKKGAAAGAEGV
jgi:hypothetical protein